MLDQDRAQKESTPDHAAERIYRTDIEALAEQFANGRRLEEGCVMMIGLDAIRDRLADRWPRRREQVWEAVDRLLERRLAPNAMHARVGEVDYLIEAGTSPKQAQAASFKLLQELHLFFLGDRRLDAMRIETVVSFDGKKLVSRPLETLPAAVMEETQSFAAPDNDLPTPRGQWSTLSFVPAGHCLQVGFERQSVVQLSSGRITASRLRPVILRDNIAKAGTDAVDGLSHAELLAVDRATMAETLAAGDGALVAPFFFETLSNTRGRAALLEALGGRAPRGLMIELIGVDSGTPHSRLLETVSLLAPYCGGVIVQAPPGRPCTTVIRGVRLSGLSVDCEEAPRSAMTVAARLADCRAHPGIGPLLFAFGLPTLTSLPLAHKAGATHASLATQIAAA